jgi:hypothetical protein
MKLKPLLETIEALLGNEARLLESYSLRIGDDQYKSEYTVLTSQGDFTIEAWFDILTNVRKTVVSHWNGYDDVNPDVLINYIECLLNKKYDDLQYELE